ncbi:MAG: helix-turn-helix domain-containing protein [Candidatus Aenigmatarchaeota archaeon]
MTSTSVSSELIDALKGINLNKYERNLWIALLRKGIASAGELAEISNVPRSRCYDVLESLADKGFAVIQPTKPIKYMAIDPIEALERAKKHKEDEVREVGTRIEKIKVSPVSKELRSLFKESIETTRPEHMSGALKGRDAMHEQVGTMIRNAKKSLKIITTADGLIEFVDRHSKVLEKAAKSGVSIQIAAPINSKNHTTAKEAGRFAKVRNLGSSGHTSKLLARVYLADSKESLMSLTHDIDTHPTQDMALWSRSSHATECVLEPMFHLVWDAAKEFK